MSKQKTKEEIRNHKTETLENFSQFMDALIESSDTTDAKRADLISYWLKDFQQYLTQEKSFDASRIKSYKRGDVVKVNLGFNVGSEQGGLRYAIVLDKDNKHNSKTITVIPLTSQKESKSVYERDIPLGRELYNRLKSKYDTAKEALDLQRSQCNDALARTQLAKDTLLNLASSPDTVSVSPNIDEVINSFEDLISKYSNELNDLNEQEKALSKINYELHKMKDGSIAKIEQITTISKQRIFDPKKSADVLSGIRFSDAAMDKINEKLKELYIF